MEVVYVALGGAASVTSEGFGEPFGVESLATLRFGGKHLRTFESMNVNVSYYTIEGWIDRV